MDLREREKSPLRSRNKVLETSGFKLRRRERKKTVSRYDELFGNS